MERDTFLCWVHENQLDVVATSEPEIPGVLEQAGLRVPDDVGLRRIQNAWCGPLKECHATKSAF